MPTSKALRSWLTFLHPRQVVFDSALRLERADPCRRSDRPRARQPRPRSGRARGPAGEHKARITGSSDWRAADEAATRAVAAELLNIPGPTEPHLQLALADLYADGDLVYTASSMPIRDQEAFLPGRPADVRFLANRGANGIDGLISSGIGAARATGSPAWIVTGDLGAFHDMNALALVAASTRRCGSSSPTTTAAGSSSSCRRRDRSAATSSRLRSGPRSESTSSTPPPLTDSATPGWRS